MTTALRARTKARQGALGLNGNFHNKSIFINIFLVDLICTLLYTHIHHKNDKWHILSPITDTFLKVQNHPFDSQPKCKHGGLQGLHDSEGKMMLDWSYTHVSYEELSEKFESDIRFYICCFKKLRRRKSPR
jgi:hypothetical protein